MMALTEQQIRASFVNASKKEIADLSLPEGFAELDFEALDVFGWRDPKLVRRAYAVMPAFDGQAVGVMFTRGQVTPRGRVQCSWCEDVTLPNPVVFYSARRAGKAGRNGDTVGALICENFECSANARRGKPSALAGFDPAAARAERIGRLQLRVAGFADDLLSTR